MIYLIDTNILIDHLRGEPTATAFLLETEGRHAVVSVITEYELLAVPRLSAAQATEIHRLLALLPRLVVTSRIVRQAAELHCRHQLDLADALIAATAHVRRATLVTRNVKHFRAVKGLRLRTL